MNKFMTMKTKCFCLVKKKKVVISEKNCTEKIYNKSGRNWILTNPSE